MSRIAKPSRDLIGVNKNQVPVPKNADEAFAQLTPFVQRLTQMMQQNTLDADNKSALTVMVAAHFFGASVAAMSALQEQFKGMMPSVVGGVLSSQLLKIMQEQDKQWTSPPKSQVN